MAYSRTLNLASSRAEEPCRNAQGESPQHYVCIDELLTTDFIARNTRYPGIGAFLIASRLDPSTFASLDARNRLSWDAFIRTVSTFPNQDAMLRKARGEWMLRRMGLVDA